MRLCANKIQLLQALKPDDKSERKEFALDIVEKMEEDCHFLNHICFNNEATFHVFGKLNKHNARIWGSENLHITKEIECESPKVNCGADFCVAKLLDYFSIRKKQ